MELIIQQIENLRMKQRSGWAFEMDDLGFLEWELLRIWHSAEYQYERFHKAKVAALLEAKLKAGI